MITKNMSAVYASGIIRRIDDLGRVVIPKEIRRELRWREGDAIEIIPLKSGDVLLSKYSHMEGIELLASHTVKGLNTMLDGISVLICDRTKYMSVAGNELNKLLGHEVCGQLMDKVIEGVEVQLIQKPIPLVDEHIDQTNYVSQALAPIIVDGSPIGAIILVSKKRDIQKRDLVAAETAAKLIAANLEL